MDIYQEVTDRIIQSLEAGAPAWLKPWKNNEANDLPHNATTGRHYNGVNVLLLWSESMARGFAGNGWMTYKQAQAVGAQVRKGERGSKVVFWRMRDVVDKETSQPAQIPMASMFTVFNTAQIDGLAEPAQPAPTPVGFEAAQAVVDQTGAQIIHGGNMPCYSRGPDVVRMPNREQFNTPSDYYATILHELTHWTAHESRLNRQLGKRFGDEAYAAEELIAEMGAAFLCAALGVPGKLQHEGYLAHWLRVLKADKRAIFTAASQAQKAANLVLGKTEAKTEAQPEEERAAA